MCIASVLMSTGALPTWLFEVGNGELPTWNFELGNCPLAFWSGQCRAIQQPRKKNPLWRFLTKFFLFVIRTQLDVSFRLH